MIVQTKEGLADVTSRIVASLEIATRMRNGLSPLLIRGIDFGAVHQTKLPETV